MSDYNRAAVLSSFVMLLLVEQAASGQGFDRLRLDVGSESGRIVGMTRQQITLDKGALEKEIPVNRIVEIRFDREPREVAQARLHVSSGAFENALEVLSAINPADVERKEVQQEVEYLRAAAEAGQALARGSGIREAGKLINDFVRRHPDSYRYYAAVESMGALLAAMGRHDLAEQQYAVLAKTPWPDYQLKAAVLVGQSQADQGEYAQAIARFDEALAIDATSSLADQYRLAARLGRAVCLAETGKAAEGIESVNRVIAAAPAGNTELLAEAYNALGRCHLKAGEQKDALLAFLHVDLLYNGRPDAHAEALYYLSSLWETVGRGDEARQAKTTLAERYANSDWARKPQP